MGREQMFIENALRNLGFSIKIAKNKLVKDFDTLCFRCEHSQFGHCTKLEEERQSTYLCNLDNCPFVNKGV